jgi:very-short-patch-repair endonuclease
VREHKVSFYRIDFFFPALKIAIEIDGQQHIRLKHQIEIDKRKNLFLKHEKIIVMRIFWKDIFQETKEKLDRIAD